MIRIFAVIMIFWCSAAAASEDRIILKWTSYLTNITVYELYVKNGKALYLVRKEAYQQPRDDDFPFWQIIAVDQHELGKKIATIVSDSKKEYEKRVAENQHLGPCQGFQWAVDIRNGNYDIRHKGHCDTKDIRNQVVNLVESAVLNSEKILQESVR